MGLLIMKKTYIIPAMVVFPFVATQTIAVSVTGVDGDTDIEIGEGDVPGTADVKNFGNLNRNIWDEAW